MSAVGKPLPHDSAVAHVTGAAPYIDDLPPLKGELVVGFLSSPVAHARITRLDISAARKIDGVAAVFTHLDVPGHNHFSPVPMYQDDVLLAEQELLYVGQPVALIAAESPRALEAAKRAIALEYDDLPATFTIEAAREAGAIIPTTINRPALQITCGDTNTALRKAPHKLSCTFTSGGQEQFYLESQAALVVPEERNQLVVYSSTQHTSEVQGVVAEVCGLKRNQVVCICRRMGGGFGGKETQAAGPAALAALVAHKLKRPARIVLDRDTDMRTTGKRHPFESRYEVGFDSSGRVTALKADLASNAGISADLSLAIMERALLHLDNAYYLPNVDASGTVYRTNLPSNTAFRGFGGPQGLAVIENVLEDIASTLGLDALDVRLANLYGTTDRNVTPYGQTVANNFLPQIFDELVRTSDYRRRRGEIDAFNRTSRTHLRGLALTPVKFGISFTNRTLNQASALVNIYLDGSVQVSSGGTEMGQGHHIKLAQLVADALGIDVANVIVMPTSTEKNNNTSPTAASAATDLNGTAAVRACEAIRARMADVAANEFGCTTDTIVFESGRVFERNASQRSLSFVELVQKAWLARVSLGERGFYATPGVDFNRETGQGTPFLYYTMGAAVSEVLVDRFTGESRCVRADLLMDIGQSINPGVDRGQVIGGFVQGMGWVTTEELCYSDRGELLSSSPTTYKIPDITDVPPDLRVAFIDNPTNTMNVRGSKAVGEPPLLLGMSVWAAIKNSLSYLYSRQRVPLRLPATGEEVLRCIELGGQPLTCDALNSSNGQLDQNDNGLPLPVAEPALSKQPL
jgi:xanthine dehydrogenase large subunit